MPLKWSKGWKQPRPSLIICVFLSSIQHKDNWERAVTEGVVGLARRRVDGFTVWDWSLQSVLSSDGFKYLALWASSQVFGWGYLDWWWWLHSFSTWWVTKWNLVGLASAEVTVHDWASTILCFMSYWSCLWSELNWYWYYFWVFF